MFNKPLIVVVTSITLLVAPLSYSKEAKRYDDSVFWKEVVKINFKIGKRSEALKIINDHFRPATQQAKTSPPELLL